MGCVGTARSSVGALCELGIEGAAQESTAIDVRLGCKAMSPRLGTLVAPSVLRRFTAAARMRMQVMSG